MTDSESDRISSFRIRQFLRNEEILLKSHQLVREKCFEYQSKFDRTIVFLSSGAIVLAYSLFDKTVTRSAWVSLFVAISLWAITFIISLTEYLFIIRESSRYLEKLSDLCIIALRQQTVEDSIMAMKAAVSQLDNGKNKRENKKLSTMIAQFASDIRKETNPRLKMLKESAEITFSYNKPHTKCNAILLVFLIGGCVAFARFTYLRRSLDPSSERNMTSVESHVTAVTDAAREVKIDASKAAINSNAVENAENHFVESSHQEAAQNHEQQ